MAITKMNKSRVYTWQLFAVIIAIASIVCLPLHAGESYRFVQQWPNLPGPWHFQSIHDVAVGDDGSVFLVDATVGRIYRFNLDGTLAGQWGEPGNGEDQLEVGLGASFSLATDGQNSVYIANTKSGIVQQFSTEGQYLRYWDPGTFNTLHIAVGQDGTVYGLDNRKVDVQLVINAALGLQTGFATDPNSDNQTDASDIQSTINAALGIAP